MLSSIRVRLSLSHLIVILLAMGLSAYLLLSFLEDYFMDATEDSLLAQARITAQALIPGAVLEEPRDTGATDKASGQTIDVRITSPISVSGTANIYQQSAGFEYFASGSVSTDILTNQYYRTPSEVHAWNAATNAVQQTIVSNLSLQVEDISGAPQDTSSADIELSVLSSASLRLSTQLETRIRILDPTGMVVVDSEQADEGMDFTDDRLVADALEGETATRSSRIDGESVMQVALPATVGDELVAVVYLSQPLGDITAVLHDVRNRLLIAAGIALAVSALVALLLSRAIANPVRRLTAAAAAVARGRYDQEVPVTSRGEIGQLSQTFNDMTARLKAARQMEVDFVANVSHESRTPLTSIKGMIETLRDGAVDDPEVRDRFLGTIEDETDRLIRLVNDLLLLSRADSDALELRRESSDLVQLVRAAVNQMAVQAGEKGITLESDVDSGTPSVPVDRDRIRQVLVNLLDNAIKYSRSGGSITLTVSPQSDDSILAEVRDEGIGIPPDELPRIGERFYRTDKARSRAQGGTGLGIAIAKALVEAHGGRLWLESQEGKGTTVRFTLPIK